MMIFSSRLGLLLAFSVLQTTLAQTWCGKGYSSKSPTTPPGGKFNIPATSSSPLLAFRCTPIFKPYLAEDATSGAGVIIDAVVTYSEVAGAKAITLTDTSNSVDVTVSVGGSQLAKTQLPLNATRFAVPFPLAGLKAQKDPYSVSCTATYNGQTFRAASTLSYLPNPTTGSVTKIDSRTGGLLTKVVGDAAYTPVFPVGFYTNFGGYLETDLSVLDDLKRRGINTVHPIPSFDNVTALNAMLDRIDELGLYLMYDMRGTYTNLTSVFEQVNSIKSRKSLLIWYTADEPDGAGDALDATTLAYNQINSLDGYHPVSLVLNCENYEFEAYSAGADILMQDAYMIGINATHSVMWNTKCTPDFGDCGCDNCVGEFEDISTRMDEFKERLWDLGWDRTKAVWTVPQAFGAAQYWNRIPTGKEWLVQSILGINHGGLGVIPWNDPTTADIKTSATLLAKNLLPSLVDFALNPKVTFTSYISNRVDVGLWTVGSQTLAVFANMNYAQAKINLAALPGGGKGSVRQLMDSGASVSGGVVTLGSVGTGAFLLSN